MEGANSTTPVRYPNPAIVMNFDLDMIEYHTNAETDALVLNAFNLWNNLLTSTVNLTQGPDLPEDVDVSNYTRYIPAMSGAPTPNDDGLRPVIYDAGGAIIDTFFGGNQSDQIAGFASSSFFLGTSAYTEGFAVINGKDLGLGDLLITLITAHEIGHFVGLDHTLADIEEDLILDMNGDLINACLRMDRSQYPLMYPVVCRQTNSLHQDDIISVSTLYPSADISQQFGQITGRFLQINNSAVLGANIWIQNTATMEVYSVVSDYLTGGTGFFSLYLPPGTYTLHANSIDPTFYGGSGVGPYSQDINSASFRAPNPITPVNYEGNTMGSTEILTVTAGEAINVTFKLDGSGSSTGGNNIFTPPTTVKKPKKRDSGGTIAPVSLMLLTVIMYLRIFRLRQRF